MAAALQIPEEAKASEPSDQHLQTPPNADEETQAAANAPTTAASGPPNATARISLNPFVMMRELWNGPERNRVLTMLQWNKQASKGHSSWISFWKEGFLKPQSAHNVAVWNEILKKQGGYPFDSGMRHGFYEYWAKHLYIYAMKLDWKFGEVAQALNMTKEEKQAFGETWDDLYEEFMKERREGTGRESVAGDEFGDEVDSMDEETSSEDVQMPEGQDQEGHDAEAQDQETQGQEGQNQEGQDQKGDASNSPSHKHDFRIQKRRLLELCEWMNKAADIQKANDIEKADDIQASNSNPAPSKAAETWSKLRPKHIKSFHAFTTTHSSHNFKDAFSLEDWAEEVESLGGYPFDTHLAEEMRLSWWRYMLGCAMDYGMEEKDMLANAAVNQFWRNEKFQFHTLWESIAKCR